MGALSVKAIIVRVIGVLHFYVPSFICHLLLVVAKILGACRLYFHDHVLLDVAISWHCWTLARTNACCFAFLLDVEIFWGLFLWIQDLLRVLGLDLPLHRLLRLNYLGNLLFKLWVSSCLRTTTFVAALLSHDRKFTDLARRVQNWVYMTHLISPYLRLLL